MKRRLHDLSGLQFNVFVWFPSIFVSIYRSWWTVTSLPQRDIAVHWDFDRFSRVLKFKQKTKVSRQLQLLPQALYHSRSIWIAVVNNQCETRQRPALPPTTSSGEIIVLLWSPLTFYSVSSVEQFVACIKLSQSDCDGPAQGSFSTLLVAGQRVSTLSNPWQRETIALSAKQRAVKE